MAQRPTMSKSVNAEAVRQLALLLNETGLTEIEYSTGDLKIRVSRQQTVVPEAPARPGHGSPVATPMAATAISTKADDASHPGAVKSPMVGTVYLAREPGAPPFVAVGDRVKEGQTLVLIEAMKTFNEIKSPRAGVVQKVLVENQSPVEYGEILMVIE